MKNLINHLTTTGYNLWEAKALEMFAGKGTWAAIHYANQVKSIDCWDCNLAFLHDLSNTIPKATITICDSITKIQSCNKSYDFINIDVPQGIYGNNYCEYFDVFPHLPKIMRNHCVLVLTVNIDPYITEATDKKTLPQWIKRRKQFYNIKDNKITNDFLQQFFKTKFNEMGYEATTIKGFAQTSKIPNHLPFIYRYLLILQRNRCQ